MCLSLRLRCLLLLNGGRQGDCVRAEFRLVEAHSQRERSLEDGRYVHSFCFNAAIEPASP